MSTHNPLIPSHLSIKRLSGDGTAEFLAMTFYEGYEEIDLILRPGTHDVAMYITPTVIEREGYQIEVSRCPCWYVRVDSGRPFGFVDAYGKDMEEAIGRALLRLRKLQEGRGI